MKVSTLEVKATGILTSMKEDLALKKLLKMNEEINRMESALALLKKRKEEFMDTEIEDVPIHEFTY